MTRLVRAELLKLRTVRSTWGLAVGGLAIALLNVVATLALAGSGDIPELTSTASLEHVFAAVELSGLAVLILGVLATSGEQRYGTLVPTFLATPRRGRVVLAKLVTYAGVGLGFAAAVLATCAALAAAWAAVSGAGVLPMSAAAWRTVGGVLLAAPLFALLGVGLGALLRNTAAAVVSVAVWVLVVERGVLSVAAPGLAKWLPSGAAAALVGSGTDAASLPVGTAALVFTAYGLALAAAGSYLMVRRTGRSRFAALVDQ